MNECQDDVFRQSIDSPWDFFGLQKKKKEMGFAETLKKAGTRALGGGVPGAIAMVLQVPFRVDFWPQYLGTGRGGCYARLLFSIYETFIINTF